MNYEIDPITSQVIWPEEVLEQAREAVIAYNYAGTGADEIIRSGKGDHWHVVQAICYAITGFEKKEPEQVIKEIDIKDRRLDLESKIFLVEQEMMKREKETRKKMRDRISFVERTLNAKLKRVGI